MAQKITIMEDSVTINVLFNQIEQQTSYTVAYNHSNINTERKISLPPIFKNINLKDALSFALKETQCVYIIRDKHIIIMPAANKRNNPYPETFSPEKEEEKFIFRGIVLDSQTRNLLGYATIYLLDSDNKILAGGASDENGLFQIVTKKVPSGIKISFIGYETLVKEINNSREDLGIFMLETTEYTISETIITGIQSKIDRKIYNITPQMRKETTNAKDLLNKIHDVYSDKSLAVIRAGNQTSVLLLVNGMRQSYDYISNLSPSRIRSIEVIYESSGRFISEDCETMINFLLEDSGGYDVFASNITTINTSGIGKDDWLTEEYPMGGISYNNNKINLYTTYSFYSDKWNFPLTKEVNYDGIKASYLDKPRDLYQSHNHNFTTGINYAVKPGNIVSLQCDYSLGNIYSEYAYLGRRSNIQSNNNASVRNRTENIVSDRILVSTLSYQGKINNSLNLHSDFSYNYYYNDMENRLGYSLETINNYNDENVYNEYKNHTHFNMDAQYLTPFGLILDAGYSNNWRQYASKSSHGKGFLDYNEYRNTGFIYLSFKYKDRIKAKSGLVVEDIKIYNRASISNFIHLLPYVQVNYKVDENKDINITYAATPYYPVLYQLSPMNINIDTLLNQVGNPYLIPPVRHTATLRFSFTDRLSLSSSFRYTINDISETYIKNNYKLYRTFDNINTKEYNIHAAYNQPLSEFIHLKTNLTFYYSKAMKDDIENNVNGWLFNAESNYYNPELDFSIRLGYYRNMKKSIIQQGYRSIDRDNWLISLNKTFSRQAISISLSYIPPISFGVRQEQQKEVNTSIYKEKSRLNLKTFNNMFFLNISFRINGTNKYKEIKTNFIDNMERQNRTIN